MHPSRIEWTDYTLNPIKGLCPVDCKDSQGKSFCYARRLYKRFKWNPEIRFVPETFEDLAGIEKPSKIFIGSTIELFGDWVKPEWMSAIFGAVKFFDRHTFIFLTKRSEELLRWSPFPPNCFIGASATNQEMHNRAIACLAGIKAPVKFISYEPLLNQIEIEGAYDLCEIQWAIIGQLTPVRKATMPKIEWVREIIEAADKVGCPVFLKFNLVGLLPIEVPFYKNDGSGWAIRQEFPLSTTVS